MGKIEQKIKNFFPWLNKPEPKEYVNWSGSLKFKPGEIAEPESTDEVSEIVKKAKAQAKTVRVVAAGHSSTPLVETQDILLSLNRMKGVSQDLKKQQATILAGSTVGEAGRELLKLGTSMHNTGDSESQNISGAIGTGAHGTGKDLPNLSAMLYGVEMVNGMGDVIKTDFESNPELLQALRVSLGTCGIFTQLIIKTIPAIQLESKEYCTHIDYCLDNLSRLVAENRNFEFYWYPRNDLAKLRILNPQDLGSRDIPKAALVDEKTGWLNEILPKSRELKYEEMEYALPAESGPECFNAVRKRIIEKHKSYVGGRISYRTVAADEAFLSPFYGRSSVTISILQNLGLPHWPYFSDIEPIFIDFGGRPHWGKKHTLRGKDLKSLYPKWNDFMEIRHKMDPKGVFLNEYLTKTFNT